MDIAPVLDMLDRQWAETLDALKDLVRIPSVSAAGFPREPLSRSAEAVAGRLREWGVDPVEVVPHEGAPPFVVGEWSGNAGAPTLLIYGHHDVQPPGNLDRWITPPWQPVERDGRLYGRGAVDDKAGIISHAAAVRAWFSATGGLPVNVKFIIEGEEEVGSPNLAGFLERHRQRLSADCLVLTDTCNLDTGIPSLTTSLRGLIMADVTVSVLDGPLHSGIWGGPIPDPVQALAKILARLTDDRGRTAIPGIGPGPEPDGSYGDLPFDEALFRAQAGMAEGVPLLTKGGDATYWATWRAPTVTVSGLDAEPIATSSNQILPQAAARIGVRLAPEQDPETCLAALVDFLRLDLPWGCRVEVTPHAAAGGWRTRPKGPYFETAGHALRAGYGRAVAHIGCGGSIPFVEPFARTMGDIPALLLGVEDPLCRAHGENESLHLGDFYSACRAAVHLYGEAGRLPGSVTGPA